MVLKKHAYVEELESRLIREIRHGRAKSRLELANRHKLAPSTIGIYVDRLLEKGFLLEEVVSRTQQPGRPAQMLSLRGEKGCFVGAEFEAKTIHAVSVDFAGKVIQRQRTELTVGANAEDVLAGLQLAIDQVLGERYGDLLGVGIGVPGLVDASAGVARHYRFIEGWEDVPISQRLRDRFKVPIFLENSARATAMGIMLFEPMHRLENFICLLVRSGVGAGIMINGSLHRGVGNLSGEVGRISLSRSGQEDERQATVEDTASLNAILHFVRDNASRYPASPLCLSRSELTIDLVIAAAKEGDDLARESLRKAIENLGWIAHVLSLVENPEAIVLSSPLNALGDWLRMELQASLARYSAQAKMERTNILLSELGGDAGALGAVSLAIEAWKPAPKR